MEIIALQQYTDKYVSLYEGEIRNIQDSLANRLIEKGIIAEHDEGSGGIPSGGGGGGGDKSDSDGWIRVSYSDPPDFVFNTGSDTLMRFEDYLTSSSSSTVYLGWKVPKWFNPKLNDDVIGFYEYLFQRGSDGKWYFNRKYALGQIIGTGSMMWMQNVTRYDTPVSEGLGSFVLMKGSDLQPAGGGSYSNLANIIDTDEWVIVVMSTMASSSYSSLSSMDISVAFKILDQNNQE